MVTGILRPVPAGHHGRSSIDHCGGDRGGWW